MDHGTGKTTITKFLVEIYNREELKIEIAAPTGKAAKRISEVTGHTASTVHRLLEIGKYEDSSVEKIFEYRRGKNIARITFNSRT